MDAKIVVKWTLSILVGLLIIAVGFRYAGWLLRTFFIINCLVLMVVVLLQSGKAADLAGAFGGAGSQTAFGPRGAANVLSKATTWCAIMFMVCAFAMVLRTDKAVEEGGGSVLQGVTAPAKSAPKPAAPAPATPAAPATSTPGSSTPSSTPAPQSSAPKPAQPAPAQPKK
ncbi:MAG TPA: preprotein translocase subunit SecG [Candidatus Acidoferrales bacterium]|nr:preprotein translocase subunit SecG [Candidatus Acidoferrales bacterium]